MLHHVTLQRGFTVDQCRHNIAVVGLLAVLQNYDVTIDNVSADHRVATDAQGECPAIFGNISRPLIERHVTFDGLFGQRRHACRDLPVNWNIGDPDFHSWSNQRPGLARVPVKKTFALQRRDVLHHRSLTREPKMTLDFARAWRNPFFSLLALDKVEHSLLPFRQHTFRIAQDPANASSNEQHPSSGAGRGAAYGARVSRRRKGVSPTLDPSLFIWLISRCLSRRDRVPQLTVRYRVHETRTQVSDNTRGLLSCRR